MMIRNAIFSSAALLFTLSGCGKEAPCEELAKSLCATSAAHCDAARPWLADQGAGDAAARDAICAGILKDPAAVSAYTDRFVAAMAPKAATPAPVQAPAAAPAPVQAAPSKPTTKEQVREVGATIEEVGTATEKAGEALDKLRDALDKDKK